ncbi:MAG: UDP-3-O-acyl-N-acetylglucosamine deacetylase [Pirellulaceae bacterium]|nr:UDP-3-O-acyl-N-acetylglucosamine deacetylase [Pirellulaceae bacterium]
MNYTARRQQTIAQPTHIDGVGYWSGRPIRVSFRPAVENGGIFFVRDDLADHPVIAATAANRAETPLRTSLQFGEHRVEMVEHVMAALHALRIDNCEVGVTAEEMPGCDGSSQAFVDAIDQAGVAVQTTAVERLAIDRVVRVGDDQSWLEARPTSPGSGLNVEYHLDFSDHPAIGKQSLRLDVTPASFRSELAAARTFVLEEQAASLQQKGLALHVTCRDLLVFDDDGPIGNTLRYTDECVRHKTLDVVGDLALAGRRIDGQVIAFRSGHRLNCELVETLLETHATTFPPLSA